MLKDGVAGFQVAGSDGQNSALPLCEHLREVINLTKAFVNTATTQGEESALNIETSGDHIIYFFVVLFAWDGNCADACILGGQKAVSVTDMTQ